MILTLATQPATVAFLASADGDAIRDLRVRFSDAANRHDYDAFAGDRHLHFPRLADFEPKGAVARAYGVYRERERTAERARFVPDGAGVVRWSHVSPVGVNPGADGILAALEALGRAPARAPLTGVHA